MGNSQGKFGGHRTENQKFIHKRHCTFNKVVKSEDNLLHFNT